MSLSLGLCSWPHDFTLVSHLSPSKLWMLSVLWPRDFRLVSHLSPSKLSMLSVLWPHDFRLVSHLSPTCLPVSSGCSQCSGRMRSSQILIFASKYTIFTCCHHKRYIARFAVQVGSYFRADDQRSNHTLLRQVLRPMANTSQCNT